MANGTNLSAATRRPWITALVILLIIFIGVGAYLELRPRRIRVAVVKPVRQEVSSSITTNGKVEPVHAFEAHAPLYGTVRKILVKEGAKVKTGQLLLELDDTRSRFDLDVARSRLKAAQERYEDILAGGPRPEILVRRQETQKTQAELASAERQLSALQRLLQRGAATPEEVSAAQDRVTRAKADLTQIQSPVRYSPEEQARAVSEINDAKANVALGEEIIRNSNVRAPFDGTIYFLPVHLGAWVNTGELLLQEADLSQLQVRAFVDEPEIGRLAVGQSVRITWDALPGHTWQGTVTNLPATVVSRGSRVVGEILCKIDNSDQQLLPNADVNATIIADSKENALTVPREAVREDGRHNFVFVVQDGHLRRRDVKLGVSNLTRVEILSGISEDDLVGVQSFSPSPMTNGVAVKIEENPS